MPHRLPQKTGGAVTPFLLMALRNAQVGVAVKDRNGRYLYLSGLPEYFPDMSAEDATDLDLFGADWLETIDSAQDMVLASGEKHVFEISRTTNAEYCACECTVQRYVSGPDNYAILMTFVDLTPERKREDMLRALLREVSHRSKNLLAIVQSIAAQTARNSDSLDLFLNKFRGRIAALSSAQDLVTDSNWQGARFFDLASRQISRYVEEADDRISIRGTDLMLSPNGATHIGLALHELIANATSHGALSRPGGEVVLTCSPLANGEENDEFEILWWERLGGGELEARSRTSHNTDTAKKFGSTVLERVVPSALNGNADYVVEPDHIEYKLRFTAGRPGPL